MNILFNIFTKNNNITPYSGTQQVQLSREPIAIGFGSSEISSMIGMTISSTDIARILKKFIFTEESPILKTCVSGNHII